jgi:hypothetical protein
LLPHAFAIMSPCGGGTATRQEDIAQVITACRQLLRVASKHIDEKHDG